MSRENTRICISDTSPCENIKDWSTRYIVWILQDSTYILTRCEYWHAPGPVATIRNLTLKQSWQKVKRDIAQSMSKWQRWVNSQFKVRHILAHIRTMTLPFLHVTSLAFLDVCGHEIPAAIHRSLPSVLALNLKFFPHWPWHPRVTRWPFVSLWIASTYLAPVWTPNIILYIYARANLCTYTN